MIFRGHMMQLVLLFGAVGTCLGLFFCSCCILKFVYLHTSGDMDLVQLLISVLFMNNIK